MKLSDAFGLLEPELARECSKALSCHERALLYSNNVNSVDPADDFISRAKKNLADFIAMLYTDTGEKVFSRFQSVYARYLKAKSGWLYRVYGQNLPDRDETSVKASMEILSGRIKTLAESCAGGEATADQDQMLKRYQVDWNALHAMNLLMMEEVSHLSKRADEINGVTRTLRSFVVAAISVCIAAGGLFFKFRDLPGNVEEIKKGQASVNTSLKQTQEDLIKKTAMVALPPAADSQKIILQPIDLSKKGTLQTQTLPPGSSSALPNGSREEVPIPSVISPPEVQPSPTAYPVAIPKTASPAQPKPNSTAPAARPSATDSRAPEAAPAEAR